jgi:hypothetical protein
MGAVPLHDTFLHLCQFINHSSEREDSTHLANAVMLPPVVQMFETAPAQL